MCGSETCLSGLVLLQGIAACASMCVCHCMHTSMFGLLTCPFFETVFVIEFVFCSPLI